MLTSDIALYSSGDVLVKGTSIKQSVLNIYGSGDLTVAGATGAVKVDLRGAGDAKIIGSGVLHFQDFASRQQCAGLLPSRTS